MAAEDGRSLLRALGVKGADADLDRVVALWDGHALTLSLLGTLLAERYGGDAAYAGQIDPVTDDDDVPDEARQRYAHVHRVLRRYDEHLTAAERAFMTLFSVFRTPVAREAFEWVFRAPDGRGGPGARPGEGDDRGDHEEGDHEEGVHGGTPLRGVLGQLGEAEFEGLVGRLVGYRLLRHNVAAETYTTHPLVRNHYLARLTGSGQAAQTHEQAKDYYLALAGDTPHNPTLADLAPLIEVVYHACRAGAYDEAEQIKWERIYQTNQRTLVNKLGAWETSLAIHVQFFPNGDASQEPQVSKASDKSWILNEVGSCLMNLGRLATAVPFYERATKQLLEQEDWHNASTGYQNLAELNANLGRLAASAAAVAQALELARRAENKRDKRTSLAFQGWAAHLHGEVDAAGEVFRQAEALEREIDSSIQYLYSLRGKNHAEHLRRVGQADTARRVTAANLEICERNRWPDDTSHCHRLLGELDAAGGDQTNATGQSTARDHFDTALSIARSISHRPTLIEALLARGRWAAKDLTGFQQDAGQSGESRQNLSGLRGQAFSDLREALGYAVDGGWRIYEADIRVALAWAHLAANDPAAAGQEAQRARTMSQEMGYHWGVVDAAEVAAVIGEP